MELKNVNLFNRKQTYMMNLKKIEEKFDEKFVGIDDKLINGIKENPSSPKEIKQFISTQITQLLEELREEDIDEKITDINYADGYNQRNQEINSKINKILNK